MVMVWITTDNVSEEAWRNLLEYANQELALEAIISRHGEPTEKNLENYRKQARQLRASILQAKEYFDAAETSSLITSPNHLYYGMVSLCSSIMLLLGSGEKALDRLRRDRNNNNHGLEFSTDSNEKTCKVGLNILENTFVTVRNSGFFLQWYSTLPVRTGTYALIKKSDANGNSMTNRGLVGDDLHFTVEQMIGHKSSLIELFKTIPDLNSSSKRYGINAVSSRIDLEVMVDANNVFEYEWRIHGTDSPESLQKILEQFVITDEIKSSIRISDNKLSAIVTAKVPKMVGFSYPSYRETINNNKIAYATNQLNSHEIVDSYFLSYALSMLSRYFPDIWVSCLESHCKAAKLIERFIFTLAQKAPVMTLGIMRGGDFVISTHRPPWH